MISIAFLMESFTRRNGVVTNGNFCPIGQFEYISYHDSPSGAWWVFSSKG